jgi:hypothetical protein
VSDLQKDDAIGQFGLAGNGCGGRLQVMTTSIEAVDQGLVHKYVATFFRTDMVPGPSTTSRDANAKSHEIQILNPVKNDHVDVIVRDADGGPLPGLDTVTADHVTIHVDADLEGLGTEPYSVTIIG